MPGAPHMRGGKPIGERSTLGVVWLFIVFPILFGGILFAVMAVIALRQAEERPLGDMIFEFGCGGVIVLAGMLAFPAVGITELRRRRRERDTENHP